MSDSGKGLIASVYPWQLDHWQRLNALVSAGRLPHAILLSGPRYIGKAQFADVFAQGLLCSQPLAGYACGQCKQCALLASHGHPDLLYIEPEDERKAIKVDGIRELDNFLSKTAQQGGWKIVVIGPAENMNVNAANALLKNLEEPSDKTLLLLVSHDPSRLPATVRSRCRQVSFGLPDKSRVKDWLEQILPERDDHELLIEQSSGKPLWALRLLETGLLDQQAALEDTLAEVESRSLTPLEAADIFMKVDDLIAIDWLQTFILKLIRSDQPVRKIALFTYLDRLQSAKTLLLSPTNPNRQLLWEELMLDWQMHSATGR